MPRVLLAAFVVAFAMISSAQDHPPYDQPPDPEKAAATQRQVAAAIAAAGCGPSELQFDVKADNQQHPMPQAEPAKALIYVFVNDGGTTRIGIDSKWVGAAPDGAYLFFAIDPGEHHLCVNVQTDKPAPIGTAGSMHAEAARIYYFEVDIGGNSLQLQRLDDANGQYEVATHSLSVTKNPPKPQKQSNDDPTYDH
jgi:hypothetical protein